MSVRWQTRSTRLGCRVIPWGEASGHLINSITQSLARVVPWGEVMDLWGKAMRLGVIPWGEAIENY